MSEENKALARRSWEIVDNLDIIEEIYAPDVVWHEPDQDVRGIDEARQFVTTYKTALPDLNITVEDVVGEGDKAVTRWTVRGTHQGEVEERHRSLREEGAQVPPPRRDGRPRSPRYPARERRRLEIYFDA